MEDNSKNLNGVQMPQLEETTYDPQAHRTNRSLDNIEAPQLDDTAYVPSKKTAGLSDVEMPVLSDTFEPAGNASKTQSQSPAYTQYGGAGAQNAGPQSSQYGAAQTQNTSPQFSQYGAVQTQNTSPQFSQYGGAGAQNAGPQFSQYGGAGAQNAGPQFSQYGGAGAQNAGPQFSQYGGAGAQNAGPQFSQYGASQAQNASSQFSQYGAAPAQPQPNVSQSSANTELNDVAPPKLDDEPPAVQRYVPKYADPDLEAAKKQSVDRAIKGSISAANESLDKEKSLAAYRDFMREKESDMAKQGAKLVIFLMIGTLISGLLAFLYASFPMKSDCPGILSTINGFYIAVGVAQLLAGGLMLAPTKSTQKASSTILTLISIIHVIPGIFVLINKQTVKTAVIFYLAIIILDIAVSFTLGSNENIKKHYNGHEID